ncbi:MAG: pantoate--beta-alanine ligase, partial [Planifilum fimeticola]
MKTVETVKELRSCLRPLRDRRIGLVPTMGYLHEGHVSLIRKAREECDVVVLSVFVNPLQFGPQEDFERYPRDLERDARIAEQAGVEAADGALENARSQADRAGQLLDRG